MKNNKGFSLVELIIVIAIMAILAAIAVASYSIYIQRAQDAADNEYKSNAEYAANLVATEHQLDVGDGKLEVELEDVVDGPEDITLVVKYPDGSEKRYDNDSHSDVMKEIYDIIGNWTFSDACDHSTCVKTVVPATCSDPGRITYSCGAEEEGDPINSDAHVWGDRVWNSDETAFTVECTACGSRGHGLKGDNNDFPIVSIVPRQD